MKFFEDSIFYFFIGLAVLFLLAGCASTGPSAEPTGCRGAAFQINPPSSYAPAAATDQTAGVQ